MEEKVKETCNMGCSVIDTIFQVEGAIYCPLGGTILAVVLFVLFWGWVIYETYLTNRNNGSFPREKSDDKRKLMEENKRLREEIRKNKEGK